MLIEIKHRWNQTILFAHDCENNSTAITLAMALKACADLSVADLRGANLSGANLRGADLIDADLSGTNLSGTDLRFADLRFADLSDADLRDANLRGADLHGADLSGADLSDANLSGADLSGADLRGTDLSGANLTPIRDDLWAVLSSQPSEVPSLIDALKNGRVDGSTYEGSCACLVGTLANASGKNYHDLAFLAPNSSRPIEQFFMGISKGDTPETNQQSKLALEWSQQWLDTMRAAFAHKPANAPTD